MVEGSKLTKHSKISFAKSGIRCIGYLLIIPVMNPYLTAAAGALFIAELLGIYEEFGATY